MTLTIPEQPGRCRWCRCTHDHPCANGCGWANRAQTLCTECEPLDQAMHTADGRRELAEFLQEYGFLVGVTMPAAARPRAAAKKAAAKKGKKR